MSEEGIMEILRTRLTIAVKTSSEYTGGLDGSGNLYRDSATILLLLDDEVISEASI